jgi:hydrogenase/urease accessory protein HupE
VSSLLVPTHLMAMLVLGLLIGQQRWGRIAIAVYVAALLVGLGAVALAYAPTRAEESLLAATAVAGFALACARPWPTWAGAALAAGTGLSLALDSPPETLSLTKANLELAMTAIGATATVWAIALLSRWLSRPLPHLATRIVGSWTAASAVLVLALRVFR